jgi:hypothetical protein
MEVSTYDLRNIVIGMEKSGSEEDRQNALALRVLYSLGCFDPDSTTAEPQEGKEPFGPSGPDGPVADSVNGYRIRSGEEE